MAGPLRGGIVGVGNVAVLGHAPGWARRADAVIAAACDPRPERRSELASHLPSVAWHDSLEAMLEGERLDFVDVCTPPADHAPAIRRVLQAGVHVLCEKPLVLDPAELASLADLARERGLALATVHNWRYAPMLARATGLVRSGALGAVRSCRWEVLRERPSVAVGASDTVGNWRLDPQLSGGGILTDHGWHAVYVIADWMGRPEVAAARLTADGRPDAVAEDTASVELRSGDVTGEIFLTWRARERRNRIEIRGDRAALVGDGRKLEIVRKDAPVEKIDFPEALSEGSHHADWFSGVASAFFDEIRHPDRRGGTLAEAKVCLEVILDARRLAREEPAAAPVGSEAGGTA